MFICSAIKYDLHDMVCSAVFVIAVFGTVKYLAAKFIVLFDMI